MATYDEISALMGAQMLPDEEEARAQAAALRGQLNDANFLSLSTINPLAQFGKSQRESVMNTAQTRGGLNRALAAEQRGDQRTLDTEGRALTRSVAAERRKAADAQGAAKLLADAKSAERDKNVFWHPTEKDAVLNLERSSTGEYFDQAGKIYPPEVVANLVPYELGANTDSKQGVTARKLDDEKDADQRDMELASDFISKTLVSPLMQGATGAFYDAPKQLAKFTGAFPEVQSKQNELSQITATAAAPMLATLGVNPTDKDLEVAFSTVPTEGNEPQVWRDWYAKRYAPLLLYKISTGKKPELAAGMARQIEETIRQMDENIARNKTEGVFKLPQMSSGGMDAAQPQTSPTAAQPSSVDDLLEKYK